MIAPADITGLVLAGGRGARMGGVDKGLQRYGDGTLAGRALARLAPQVGRVAISANRHLGDYETLGVPVWTDDVADHDGDFAGPLAGMLAGLARCATPYLAVVPCDAPLFPLDLVARLAAAFGSAAAALDLTVAATDDRDATRLEATFCLLRVRLAERLRADLARGERKASRWLAQQRHAVVRFDEAHAFTNANTLEALALLQPS